MGVSKSFVDVYGKDTPQQRLEVPGLGEYCILIHHNLDLLEEDGDASDTAYTCFKVQQNRFGRRVIEVTTESDRAC